MTVSFDGLRTNATRSMNLLRDALKEVVELDEYDGIDDELKEDVIAKFNSAAMFVDTFNCLYDDKVEDDFNSMDNLSINRLEEI